MYPDDGRWTRLRARRFGGQAMDDGRSTMTDQKLYLIPTRATRDGTMPPSAALAPPPETPYQPYVGPEA